MSRASNSTTRSARRTLALSPPCVFASTDWRRRTSASRAALSSWSCSDSWRAAIRAAPPSVTPPPTRPPGSGSEVMCSCHMSSIALARLASSSSTAAPASGARVSMPASYAAMSSRNAAGDSTGKRSADAGVLRPAVLAAVTPPPRGTSVMVPAPERSVTPEMRDGVSSFAPRVKLRSHRAPSTRRRVPTDPSAGSGTSSSVRVASAEAYWLRSTKVEATFRAAPE
mmetsp:Transcript_22163/g.59778  ORF Transcript_22163/g.59778 Transcript_22163/m.59778 type:complete len:226 (-) Transcript_22163:485-1162(-)